MGPPQNGRPIGSSANFSACFSLDRSSRLDAICNTTCPFDKTSDRKLRSAIYVRTTQVARYVGRDETRERAIFQVDSVPTVAADCGAKKKLLCYCREVSCHLRHCQ